MERTYTDEIRRLRRAMLVGSINGYTSIPELHLRSVYIYSDTYMVLLCDQFRYSPKPLEYNLLDIVRVFEHAEMSYEEVNVGGHHCIIFIGKHAVQTIQKILKRLESASNEHALEKGSPLDSYFLARGCIVSCFADLGISYREAITAYNSRFFMPALVHTLGGSKPKNAPDNSVCFDDDFIRSTTKDIVGLIQLFDRNNLNETLTELNNRLCKNLNDRQTAVDILTNIYFGVREHFLILYNASNIPFAEYSYALNRISQGRQVREIVDFLHDQFIMIMKSIGYSSRESIIDDVIYYVNHNYMKNITLENIAPVFGYNSSYLGKIFYERTHMRLNSYLDSVRIEHAKEILKESSIQVYKVAEMVGYKNVDYFHMKFKKYAGCSPLEYKKSEA
ncbi:MAG: helix-turn-helix domain-containing protein [Lachnospiraceae bacterium]|nr:helix-turn-helix domain-containing protein [Lachnospiraceae bacterium]